MESHDQAHEAALAAAIPPVIDHPLIPRGDPQLVTRDSELRSLVDRLRAAGSFGYDSEFIGEHTYYPRFCVIQVATPQEVTLIDVLEPLDLAPFWQLLADPAVETIVHAGEQDLEPVLRQLGRAPANIFDTQIAAGFAGCPYPSALGRLASLLLGADLGHGLKFSQWDRRPLSPVQLHYAANDVRYLPAMRAAIGERLAETGNAAWAREECATLADPARYTFDAQTQRLRVRGTEWLSPRQDAVLRALVGWREALAQQRDMPPRTLLADGVVMEIARTPPRDAAELARVRGLPRPVAREWGAAIIELIARALDSPLASRPAKPPPSFDFAKDRARTNALWERIAERARSRNIDPAVVTSKKELATYLRLGDAARGDARLLRGWRRELLQGIEELAEHRAS
jgi:ribonuclease D